MQTTVKVEGLKELERKLDKIASELDDKSANGIVKNALRVGARQVRDDAKSIVPKDDGDLQEGIVVRTLSKRQAAEAGVDPNAANVVVTVKRNAKSGAALFYARFIEFGRFQRYAAYKGKDGKWYTNKKKKLDSPRWIPGSRFLTKAFDKNKQQLPELIANTLRQKIDDFIRKYNV